MRQKNTNMIVGYQTWDQLNFVCTVNCYLAFILLFFMSCQNFPWNVSDHLNLQIIFPILANICDNLIWQISNIIINKSQLNKVNQIYWWPITKNCWNCFCYSKGSHPCTKIKPCLFWIVQFLYFIYGETLSLWTIENILDWWLRIWTQDIWPDLLKKQFSSCYLDFVPNVQIIALR